MCRCRADAASRVEEGIVSGGRRTDTPRTVTGRTMTILGVFTHGQSVMGIQEISRLTGLPVSTTHRLVTELVQWEALARNDEYTYRVGPLVLRLAAAAGNDQRRTA
jgi:DNA-binding IclR family transcriptional regulator